MLDREKVIRDLQYLISFGGASQQSLVQQIASDALALLKEQPEIVRCKDCKNWVGNGADIDELPYWLPCKGEMRRPDYFCADGERRTDDA